MKVYAFVPAKSTSSRIGNKNCKILAGDRLFARALKILLQCKEIDKIFLDTDSVEMYGMVDYLPVEFMRRDPALCTNATDGHALFMNEVNSYPDADIYVQLLCTSPFIKPESIDNAIKLLKENGEYDSAVMVRKEKFYFWKDGQPEYGRVKIPNSFDLPDTIVESMGLYIHKKDSAIKLSTRYGLNPYLIPATPIECVDINTPEDMELAKALADGLLSQENKYFALVKSFLNSAVLSDIIDDLNMETGHICGSVLSGFQCNMPHVKRLGRAATLKLRKLKPGEDFRGIYKALQSYESITANNIICVQNDTPEYAYFGDLNARLAIRAGACGAIINGVTRDSAATAELSFPVLSKGVGACDVRRKAVLDYMDKPIYFGDNVISPGDLIFFDIQSAVILYPKYEKEIIQRALQSSSNEDFIVNDIIFNKNTDDIVHERGAF